MDYRLVRQSSGWLYLIFHPLVHITYRLLFRKIYLHNRTGVKANTPVLIAANHPTAFIDPIFFCIFFDPPVYNMTRGDIFRKPFFRKLMESVNMFPVYRRRDGYDGRDRNDEVFEYCQRKLREGVAVNIFVEGEHHLDKRVLPAQKGIARIAFGTFERHPMDDLQIVPVGCNYIYGDRSRDEAKVIVGQPIFVKDYWAAYTQNPGAAISQLCRDIEIALKKICYHIENREDDELAEQLLSLWRNEHPDAFLPVVEHRAPRFFEEKKLLDRLNELPEIEKKSLKNKVDTYFSALQNAGLNDEALMQPSLARPYWLLLLIVLAPVAAAGFFIGFPVRFLSRYLTGKAVNKVEFYTSVLMGIATFSGLIYVLLLLLIAWLLDWPWLVMMALLLPVLVWISIFWKETWLRWNTARKAGVHPDKKTLLDLRAQCSI
ncbi:MAG: 1-acyl-sn-glycerol-3-phosphate acyltransferase [Saprospiraceae bacterium]|nr:1-acyl-sn-glycerol-3-phosphate acyltransferase [Saprospiraceae bacterium]